MRTAREVTEELIRCGVTDDPAQVDLYADDGYHDLPFSPTGAPVRFTKDRMRATMNAGAAPRFVDRRIETLEITEAGDRVLAEFVLSGTLVATGERLSITNAMVIDARDGLIVRSRNYLNPEDLRRLASPLT